MAGRVQIRSAAHSGSPRRTFGAAVQLGSADRSFRIHHAGGAEKTRAGRHTWEGGQGRVGLAHARCGSSGSPLCCSAARERCR